MLHVFRWMDRSRRSDRDAAGTPGSQGEWRPEWRDIDIPGLVREFDTAVRRRVFLGRAKAISGVRSIRTWLVFEGGAEWPRPGDRPDCRTVHTDAKDEVVLDVNETR